MMLTIFRCLVIIAADWGKIFPKIRALPSLKWWLIRLRLREFEIYHNRREKIRRAPSQSVEVYSVRVM